MGGGVIDLIVLGAGGGEVCRTDVEGFSGLICAPAVVVIWTAVAASSVTAIESLNTGPNRGASVPATAASRFNSNCWRLPLRNASSLNPTFGSPVVSTGVSE